MGLVQPRQVKLVRSQIRIAAVKHEHAHKWSRDFLQRNHSLCKLPCRYRAGDQPETVAPVGSKRLWHAMSSDNNTLFESTAYGIRVIATKTPLETSGRPFSASPPFCRSMFLRTTAFIDMSRKTPHK